MDDKEFRQRSVVALESLEAWLSTLDAADLDVELGGDVLTLTFDDGIRFIINAHSAARQIWMAARTAAWHFDWDGGAGVWFAPRQAEELFATVSREVGAKLGRELPR